MGLTRLPGEKEKIKISRNNRPVPAAGSLLLTSGGQTGFTLVELTIVLFLITLMLGVVGTNFYKIWQREQLKVNFRQVAGVLRQARSEAVSRNRKVQVRFDLAEQRYWVENFPQEPQRLPPVIAETVQLVWLDQARRQGHITFYGDGSSSGGRLTFSGPNQLPFNLVVDRTTGQINSGSR